MQRGQGAPVVQVDGVVVAHGGEVAVGRLHLAAADPVHLQHSAGLAQHSLAQYTTACARNGTRQRSAAQAAHA